MIPGLSAELSEGFAWVEGFTNYERRQADSLRPFRLDRMRAMAAMCGNPHLSYRAVHIAGSKGKGSTAAFLGAILTEAGFRTGIYTSPHVESYRERFLLGHGYLADDVLKQSMASLRERLADHHFNDGSDPTTFELLTLLGMIAFREAECDWVVFETGLGGRLDATNILLPELTLITSIELEHTRILGTTLAAVAGEKAGIIKAGVPLITGTLPAEAATVIEQTARDKKAPCSRVSDAEILSLDDEQICFRFPGRMVDPVCVRPGMRGVHQGRNALLAAMGAGVMLGTGEITLDAILKGIARAALPGRFEIQNSGGRDWIYDAAHTKESVGTTAEIFRRRYPDGGVAIIAVVDEKDVEGICAALPSGLRGIVVTQPGTFKASSPEKVHAALASYYPGAELIFDTASAVRRAEEMAAASEPVLVTGSFYLLGVVRAARKESRENWR